jgi:hypothetical protein
MWWFVFALVVFVLVVVFLVTRAGRRRRHGIHEVGTQQGYDVGLHAGTSDAADVLGEPGGTGSGWGEGGGGGGGGWSGGDGGGWGD